MLIGTILACSISPGSQVFGFQVIWQNGGDDGGNILVSQLDPLLPFNAQVADDFLLPDGPSGEPQWLVTGVRWNGVYFNNSGPVTDGNYDFNIIIYADNGVGTSPTGGPGDPTTTAIYFATFSNSAVNETPTFVGFGLQRYSYFVDLTTPFLADVNTQYWLSVQGIGTFPLLWGWAHSDQPQQLGAPVFGGPGFGIPYWTVAGTFAAFFDEGASFELIGIPIPVADCNNNDIPDATDIADGTSHDCNKNAVPDECEPSPLPHWADSVIDFSSQFDLDSWSATQALGEPDVLMFGDSTKSWSPTPQNGSIEFITLGYDGPVFASGVTIRENLGNGFVIQVDVIDTNDVFHTMWTGTDPSQPGQVVDFLITWPQTLFLVKGVNITIDTDLDQSDWEEIDAVQLHGVCPVSNADCNSNTIPDNCDIACGVSGGQCDVAGCGASRDCNANGIPDECETCGDLDGDGDVDGDDFTLFLAAFGLGVGAVGFEPCADADGDSLITFVDYQQWLQCYRSFIGSPFAPPPTPQSIGDMDGSGTVDGSDIQPFVDAMLEPATAGLRARFMADVNGDGAVDSADAGEFVGLLLSQQ